MKSTLIRSNEYLNLSNNGKFSAIHFINSTLKSNVSFNNAKNLHTSSF